MGDPSLVVISGGLDSSVLCHDLVGKGRDVRGIYFNIGYRPALAERASAKLLCNTLGIPLEIVEVPGILEMVAGLVPIEQLGRGELDKGQPTPIRPFKDYVVGFPVILSLASYYAALSEIRSIYLGLIGEQFTHNRGLKAVINGWAAAINPLNPSRPVELQVPFATVSKAKVVMLGRKLGVDFTRTWSCHLGGDFHCGKCSGCRSRRQAFKGARFKDPTKYV